MLKEKQSKEKLTGIICVYNQDIKYHPAGVRGLLPARPLKKESLKQMFNFVNDIEDFDSFSFEGLVPENILKYNTDNGAMKFYTKPCYRTMIFNNNIAETTTYSIPYILWDYSPRGLSVYALKKKPNNEDDILYQAPFLNISGNGNVCMGNVKFSNKTGKIKGYDEILVDMFFDSVFTHTNCDKLATINILDAYKLAKSKDFVWDKYLLKTTKKLKDVL